MSGAKRSRQQVKIKYKNILQDATKKRAAAAAAGGGGGGPPAACTPAEVMRSIIEGGTSLDIVPASHVQSSVKVVDGVLTLLDPEQQSLESVIAGPSTTQEDEETISICPEMLAV